jgi:hypothetical protein
MRPFVASRLLFAVIGLALLPARIFGLTGSSTDMPARETAPKLLEAWLRYHEADLCQGVDAVFVSHGNGMEVWCLVEDERSYQKLQELLEPLRSSYRIELYTTRRPAEKRAASDTDPPPSLWENYELRSFMGDPFARAKESLGLESPPGMDVPPLDETLKQRLFVYAEQTLDWNRRMKRYAMDLPVLASVALDPGTAAELRLKASAVCMAHAQSLSKYIGKLAKNLAQALPNSAKEESLGPEKPLSPRETAADSAMQISVAAQNVAQRVYRFIHPAHYTVGLDELRQPSLLRALAALDRMDLDFQRTLAKPAHR